MHAQNDIEQIAHVFAVWVLGDWLTVDEYAAMREANRKRQNTPLHRTCASHDYCDANEAMAHAFKEVIGRDFDMDSRADGQAWDEAWNLAKRLYLTA